MAFEGMGVAQRPGNTTGFGLLVFLQERERERREKERGSYLVRRAGRTFFICGCVVTGSLCSAHLAHRHKGRGMGYGSSHLGKRMLFLSTQS
jgi:hypothetical protein